MNMIPKQIWLRLVKIVWILLNWILSNLICDPIARHRFQVSASELWIGSASEVRTRSSSSESEPLSATSSKVKLRSVSGRRGNSCVSLKVAFSNPSTSASITSSQGGLVYTKFLYLPAATFMFALSKKQTQLKYIKVQKGFLNIGPLILKVYFCLRVYYQNLRIQHYVSQRLADITNLSDPPFETFRNSAAWYEKWYGYTCEADKLLPPALFNNAGVYMWQLHFKQPIIPRLKRNTNIVSFLLQIFCLK